jgi:hypothetical protein
MSVYSEEQIEVEKKELEVLKKLNFVFNDSLDTFNTCLKDSLDYIYYVTLPIVMASLENRSFNPFSEIIEKHISFIVNSKMISLGYKMIPLGYSSDLTFEDDKTVINIDIKTANINNPSDFKEDVALGLNQTSYAGKLPCGIRGKEYYRDGVNSVKTFPNLPKSFKEKNKLTITNGLLFIYPDYKDIIDEIRNDYIEIREILDSNLKPLFKDIFDKEENLELFLNYKPSSEKFKRREFIIENLVRAFCVHDKNIEMPSDVEEKLKLFSKRVSEMADKLSAREIKPVAIISVSIPNGILEPHYDTQVVSGKSWGRSIRYHYEEGIFKGLKERNSRVIFIDYDEKYLPLLKDYFRNIVTYKIEEHEL